MLTVPYNTNETIKMYRTINTVLYFCGLTNIWIEDVNLPPRFVKVFNYISVLIEIIMVTFLALEIGSYFTQSNLSPGQLDDLRMFTIAQSSLYSFVLSLMFYKKRVRDVLYQLAVGLKKVHNDKGMEAPMLKQVQFYIFAYMISTGGTMVLYGTSATLQYIKTRAPLTTVITAWPDVQDDSGLAQLARIMFFVIWCIFFFRISGSFVLVITMLISLRYQFKNVASYFESIRSIFEKSIDRSELEDEYEVALSVGIKLHQDTLWCVQQYRVIYSYIFSGQIILSLSELVAFISHMTTSERTFVNIANVVIMALSVMLMAGFVLWNAGDVTVEASYLPEAMYSSGWQNCAGASSARVRKLLSLAMLQAQKPVDFVALGCVSMSYKTYLAICKSAYSVFSVLY